MKKNIGNPDRIFRVLFAVVVAALYFGGIISGTLAAILGLVAVILFLTSAVGFCPIYYAFKLTTLKKAAS